MNAFWKWAEHCHWKLESLDTRYFTEDRNMIWKSMLPLAAVRVCPEGEMMLPGLSFFPSFWSVNTNKAIDSREGLTGIAETVEQLVTTFNLIVGKPVDGKFPKKTQQIETKIVDAPTYTVDLRSAIMDIQIQYPYIQ